MLREVVFFFFFLLSLREKCFNELWCPVFHVGTNREGRTSVSESEFMVSFFFESGFVSTFRWINKVISVRTSDTSNVDYQIIWLDCFVYVLFLMSPSHPCQT